MSNNRKRAVRILDAMIQQSGLSTSEIDEIARDADAWVKHTHLGWTLPELASHFDVSEDVILLGINKCNDALGTDFTQ